MGIRLPMLTHDVDLGKWQPAYAGLVVTVCLNPPVLEYEPPWAGVEDEKETARIREQSPAWAGAFYHVAAARLVQVTIPAPMTDGGREEVIHLETAEDVYRLEHRADFDPGILAWVLSEYPQIRSRHLAGALKN